MLPYMLHIKCIELVAWLLPCQCNYNNQGLDVSYVDEIKTKDKRIVRIYKYPQTFSVLIQNIYGTLKRYPLPSATQNEVQLVDVSDHGIVVFLS